MTWHINLLMISNLQSPLAIAVDHTLPLAPPPSPAEKALREKALALLDLPFNDLLFRAQTVHRENFDPNRVQRSTLLSIKTGGCSEDCGYCPQSARHPAGVENEPMLRVNRELGYAVTAHLCEWQAVLD